MAPQVSPHPERVGTSRTFDEPLLLSAPLAKSAATLFCHKDSASGQDCSWIHGPWQYLRALRLVTTPEHQADFLCTALQSLARTAHRRVLISGAADYSMLAHVLRTYAKEGVSADVTVVDLCETPLFLCRWYARGFGVRVETVASDILDYKAVEPFDLVCTHAFLEQFSPAGRKFLMAKWQKLLRPGGAVVTVTSLRPSAAPEEARFAPDQARAFRDTAVRRAEESRDVLAVDPEEVAKWVEVYTQRCCTYPIRSREEILGLFIEGGFAIEYFDSGELGAVAGRQPSGPTAAGSADYAQVIASRSS